MERGSRPAAPAVTMMAARPRSRFLPLAISREVCITAAVTGAGATGAQPARAAQSATDRGQRD